MIIAGQDGSRTDCPLTHTLSIKRKLQKKRVGGGLSGAYLPHWLHNRRRAIIFTQPCTYIQKEEGNPLGEIDIITKEYLKDPQVFADAFNKFLYHGRQVILPETLTELDTTEIVVPYGSDGAVVPEQKYRDNVKLAMTDGRMAYCILGAEGQDKVHYAMPVKNGVYDFMQLARQVTEAARSHRRAKDAKNVTGDEFLSGFYKTDRLLPVVTLVVFFGSEEWDGPLLLKDMYADVDGEIMKYVPDYKVNLLAPNQIPAEELGEFTSSLKEVMTYIKYAKDMEKLDEAVQNDERFRHLERQAVDVINVTTSSGLKYDEGEEEIDVCGVIQTSG